MRGATPPNPIAALRWGAASRWARALGLLTIALLAARLVFLATTTAAPAQGSASTPPRLLVPAYFPPGADWDRLVATLPAGSIAIMNLDRGPGAASTDATQRYLAQMWTAQAAGIKVVGYVPTGYGVGHVPAGYSGARALADIEADIDKWYAWFTPDGIFLDEGPRRPVGSVYEHLRDYIQAKAGRGHLIVLNQSGYSDDDWAMAVADIVCVFEAEHAIYAAETGNGGRNYPTYSGARWTGNYPPDRVAHLIYNTPDDTALAQAASLAQQRGAGWLYVTPLAPPADTWGRLPDAAYWDRLLTLLGAATPTTSPPETPISQSP
jgi:hypothetical protein